MQLPIDERGPRVLPGLDHQDSAAHLQGSLRLEKKQAHVRDVMKDIGHHDRAQNAIAEWKLPRVEGDVDAAAREHFGRDQARNHFAEEAGARTDLQYRARDGRQMPLKLAVPLLVDQAKEPLAANDLAAHLRHPRVVDVQLPRRRMSKHA